MKVKPAMANSEDSDKKVFDVAKPGETAADASSRPVIVGHKNLLKDPMVKDNAASELNEGEAPTKQEELDSDDKPSGSPNPSETAKNHEGHTADISSLKVQPHNEDVKKSPLLEKKDNLPARFMLPPGVSRRFSPPSCVHAGALGGRRQAQASLHYPPPNAKSSIRGSALFQI